MVKHGKATKATEATKPGWKTKQNPKKTRKIHQTNSPLLDKWYIK
jgi:hypothetical protein